MYRITQKIMVCIVSVLTLAGCNHIPNKSISEDLSPKELAAAIESDSTFAILYKAIRTTYDSMDKVEQAQFYNLSYRDISKFSCFMDDTAYWFPLRKQWQKTWDEQNAVNLQKTDSIIQYWEKFKEENSLDNYVKIELARVSTDYYDYIGGVKEVDFGFLITPLKGKVDQIKFKYRLTPKISEGKTSLYDDIMNSNMCILTSPVTSPTVRYWKASYSDEKIFGGHTAEQVLRDYDLKIEVRQIRYNGTNIDDESLGIPEPINDYLKYGYGKDEITRGFVDKDFKTMYEYFEEEATKICEKKDKVSFAFFKKID